MTFLPHIGFYLPRKSPEQSSWQCDSARVVDIDCVVADTVTDRTDGSKVTVYDAEVRE